MKNILLVSPQSDNEALWITGDETAEIKNNFPPISLATIAALTPSDQFNIRIWDENVHGLIARDTQFDETFDLVGLTGFNVHLPRCVEIANIFRARGVLVAMGGPGISSVPHAFRHKFDILFINEAEYTWPQFLHDWQYGEHKSEYRQIDKPDLVNSPIPKFDSMVADMCRYSMGIVQTTRGCPFDCEFCDVIYLFGRRPRHKPIEKVIEEVRIMADYGLTTILFSDDEFSGDRHYSKSLCRELIKLNASLPKPLTFTTQISLSISRDEEFLGLLAYANFDLVFIGVESPKEESLLSTNKVQNLRGGEIGEQIRKILSYGIGIRAGLIVGFDGDDQRIFEQQYRFIQDACLTSFGVFMLKAPVGTKLWQRMMREKRVVDMVPNRRRLGHPRSYTNIIPKQLTRIELYEGFRWLLERAYTWESFAERICGFVSLTKRQPSYDLDFTFDLDQLIAKVKAGPEAAEAISKIVNHTQQVAPNLMKKVRTLVLQHAKYCETVQRLLPQIDRQIELERQGKIIIQPDTRQLPASEDFRKAFNHIFRNIHRRVYLNLQDKTKVPHALTEVFVDFLIRWGEDFKTLEDYHVTFLLELCDRTCAQWNGESPERSFAFESDEVIPNVTHQRLADDIFKNVWMEMNEFYITGKRSYDPISSVPAQTVGQFNVLLDQARARVSAGAKIPP
jgi:radical SAM superfamily enzyme YgiQ (UPF0313 family)